MNNTIKPMTKIEKDPLEVLIKSGDYMEGYRAGCLATVQRYQKLERYLEQTAVHINSFLPNRKRSDIETWVITHESIILNKHYSTKDEAWAALLEILGDKVQPFETKYRIERI